MSELVLIIGVTSYIGFQTLRHALQGSYTVRAIVQKSEQISKLQSHPAISLFISSLSFVIVPDMTIEGAFDAALQGVTNIIQLSSPLANETEDYDRDIVNPAIAINSSILNSASKVPTVRRVVITSPAVTLIPFEALASPDILASKTYDSTAVNLSPKRPFSNAMEAYWASKALARLSVRVFFEKKKDIRFDYVQLLPSVVIGTDPRVTS